ncbi:MAG: hypothetical protein ETSY1_03830 [Candidatus Entotheonella factor]|uniref:DoxX family protein n=1 Tax=Entotheonella factor TaxID=1429438 RepID=W4LWS0_ENTF1|nr:DoxX family membrane protein [Candidatus Entotheonella palauensis]ETX02365.1 MAG: hypothetical protein ETSY1_03830 [Candidatus Entotheonella factor]
MDATWCGQVAVSAFFAIVFLQSGLDKFVDRQGNLGYITGFFSNSPLKSLAPAMFWAIAVLETIAGILTAIGTLIVLFGGGTALALWGLVFSTISLLCLLFGNRMAKEYGGATVIATYFAIALLGFMLL